MPQRLDFTKAIQAVGVLLRQEGKRASRLRLLKLLYIADRVSLEKTGCQILGSRIVAMKHGPLHSEVLDLINGEHIHSPQWSQYFQNVGRDVVLAAEPEIGRLSRYEIEILNQVVDDYKNCSDWDVADMTHSFAEWQKIYSDPNESTSRPIPIELLIDSTGRGADKAAILQDMKDSDVFNSVFARLCCR
jgi:uncharacterized phage-associated protein